MAQLGRRSMAEIDTSVLAASPDKVMAPAAAGNKGPNSERGDNRR